MRQTMIVNPEQLNTLNPGDKLVLKLRQEDTTVLESLKTLCSAGYLSLSPRVQNIIREVGGSGTWTSDQQRELRVEPTTRFNASLFAELVLVKVEAAYISRKKSARTPRTAGRLQTVKVQKRRQGRN